MVGEVSLLDFDEHLLIFNYHEKLSTQDSKEIRLRNTLQVIEKPSGRAVFEDVVDSATAAVVPDSFFVQHRTLYYIRDRHRLVAVPLSERLPSP